MYRINIDVNVKMYAYVCARPRREAGRRDTPVAISTPRTQMFGFRVLFSTDRSQGSSEKWPIPVLRRSTLFAKKIRMC